MFCPKCSQQQIADETRFCSRCGFQLNVVKALLVSESIPAGPEFQSIKRSFSKRDMTIGVALMFFLALIVAVFTIGLGPNESARIIPLLVGGIALTLLINIKPLFHYFRTGDTNQVPTSENPVELEAKYRRGALPPSQSIPAGAYISPPVIDTARMAKPQSVTDETTNLLHKQ